MISAAHRMRKARQRHANGLAVLHIEVELGALADELVAAGFLQEWDCEDREAIERAVERVLAALIAAERYA